MQSARYRRRDHPVDQGDQQAQDNKRCGAEVIQASQPVCQHECRKNEHPRPHQGSKPEWHVHPAIILSLHAGTCNWLTSAQSRLSAPHWTSHCTSPSPTGPRSLMKSYVVPIFSCVRRIFPATKLILTVAITSSVVTRPKNISNENLWKKSRTIFSMAPSLSILSTFFLVCSILLAPFFYVVV